MQSFCRFSALQRAEIAEIAGRSRGYDLIVGFSALQRAEIAEMRSIWRISFRPRGRFSALQRAEIAEIFRHLALSSEIKSFSALQRAEIAEIDSGAGGRAAPERFQCSSTSRNC